MMQLARVFALALCALVASPLAPDAVAEQSALRLQREAERRNARANRLYERGKYEQALQLYQAAFDLHAVPKYRFNIALAREKTFDYEGCAVAFRDYLERAKEEAGPRELARAGLRRCLERAEIAVRVTSVPTNAAVFLEGAGERRLEGRTPLELELPPGKHRLRVERSGFVPEARELVLEVGTAPQADFVLERLASIRIDVDPPGARVKVGELDWQAAPIERELRAGTHRVRVEREGYEATDVEVEAVPGREVALVLSLKRLPILRTLHVKTAESAEDTVVAVDGEPQGAPPVSREISPGTHRIEVSSAGHIPYAGDITVPEDRDLSLRVSLARKRTATEKAVFWSLAGATGVAAAIGASFGVLAARDQASFDDGQTVALHQRGEDRAGKADIFLGTAVVLGAASAVYYFATRPGRSTGNLE